MNLIARQSLKYSMLSYVGVAIGMLASVFLYPYDFAYMGQIRFLLSSATALFPFILMGTSAAMVKYFPEFTDIEGQLNLFYLAILTLIVNSFVVAGIYIFMQSFDIIPYFINDIWAHFPYILLLSFLLALIQVGSKYVSNFGRIAIPVIYENLFPKIALVLSFCAFVFWGMAEDTALAVFLLIIFVSVFGLFFYLSQFQTLKAQNPLKILKNKKFTQSFYTFSGYSVLGGIGTIMASQIDIVMIREMLSSYSTGIYATMLSIAGLMFIPYYAVNSISGPIISNMIFEKQWQKLKEFYQKVSMNLFFLGSFMFCLMIAGAPSLFELMKNGSELQSVFPILYILGGAAVFDLMTGFNSQIIAYSKYYKFTLLITVVLAFMVISLNYYFIKELELGIIGVAISSGISLFLFNLSKMVFIGLKFNIWPFHSSFIRITFIFILGIILALFIPETANAWFSLFYKPLSIIACFFIGNQLLGIVDFKALFSENWRKALMG